MRLALEKTSENAMSTTLRSAVILLAKICITAVAIDDWLRTVLVMFDNAETSRLITDWAI